MEGMLRNPVYSTTVTFRHADCYARQAGWSSGFLLRIVEPNFWQKTQGINLHSCKIWGIPFLPYLLGLLAMIKCSICSYQCDNWYISNWRFACHMYFSMGRSPYELAHGSSCVALAQHIASCGSPFRGNAIIVQQNWTGKSNMKRRAALLERGWEG